MTDFKGAMLGKSSSFPEKWVVSPTHRCVFEEPQVTVTPSMAQSQEEGEEEIDVNLSEVYFLIMHFLSSGPCSRATGQLWNELLQHKLLPRRYHAWYSRTGLRSGDEDDDGMSFPLSYIQVLERNPDIQKDHLVKLLQRQLMACRRYAAALEPRNSKIPTAADVPTLLGLGSFSLLCSEPNGGRYSLLRSQLRWPHGKSGQVRGLALREMGGGFAKHHRSPSIRAASYAILKPSVLVDKIQIIKKFRGHRNAVYCAIFDKTGQHIITGSDDRLVKIWSTETGFCLRSCRGHEGDITELSVSSGSTLVASASNDYTIRVWRLPDGVPVSVLRGHRGAVTAIAFSPRQSCEHHLLSSSDDGTCRIWDARDSALNPRVYIPNPELLNTSAKSNLATQPVAQQPAIQISCCAFNADGSIFVTGSSDKFARVWDARKWNDEITGKPNYEMDILKGHENAVNYVQFCGCAGTVKPLESMKEDRITKFKNVWLAPDSIVTCSRDGSAIIWICKPRRKNARYTHWSKAYHLRVPPPPMPPHPPRVGGPRQRLLPTPCGVNMIVWSLDNRFVLAAIMDCRICVWNAVDGSLVHSLTGHTKSTFVVDVHPFNPRIAMSAGYDGRVIIWDIWEGQPVRVYETGDFQIVDGCFSPDGTSLVVSDEVGQFYLLGTGQGQSQKDAKYDQFFLGDFRPLVRDIQGNVLDQETQLPPHQRNIQDLLCDANMIPYEEPYQSMYQQRRLGALGIDWKPLRVNLAVGTDDVNYLTYRDHPFVVQPNIPHSPVDAPEDGARRWVEQPRDVDEEMDWDQDASRPSDDSGSDYSVSEESLSLIDEDEGTASSTEGMGQSHEEVDDVEDSEREISIRRSIRYKRRAEGTSSDFLERKARKLAANLQMVEESDNNNVEQTPMQEQADRVIPAVRDGKYRWVTRPKRAAATNAMQMLSHIHSKEDGDEEDASSSHDETSCYNTEEEAESDGLPASLPLSSDHKECEQAQQTHDMEAEGREECSESSERDVEGKEDVTVLKHINEDLGCQTNIEKAMATTNVESRTQYGHVSPDDVERKTENHKKSEVGSKVLFLEQRNSEIGGNTLRPIDSSGPPLSQRRLVVKLRSNKVGLPSKTGFEDMAYAGESTDSKGAHASIDEDGNKQNLTRCILNLPDSAMLFQESHRGFSGTGDNGTYNPIQSTTLKSFNYEEAQPPARHQKKQKMKGQSVPDRVSKKAKVHEPASMNPTGSSSSGSDSGSCGAHLDPSGKAAHRTCSNVICDTSDHETEVDSGGLDWVRKLESRPTNLDFSQTEVATVSRTQRLSSPESFARCHPWEEKDSTVNDNPCEDWALQNDKPITGSRSGTKRNGAEMSHRRVDAGGSKLHTSKPSSRVSVDEPQQDWESSGSSLDATDTEDGPLFCRKSRTKAPCKISNVMHEQNNSQFLQGSEEDHSGSQSLKNSAHLFCKRSSSESEEFESDERDGSYGVQTTVAEVDEIRQHFSEGHTESDPYHDRMKWTESESFGGGHSDAQYLKHRRTLGEIEPTNLSVEGSKESPGNNKVRHMQSVMSEGIKACRLKGNRGRRTTILRKEGEGKAGRQAGWSNRYLNHREEGMEEGTSILPDKGNWHDNQHARRPKGRASGKSEQAGEPVCMDQRDLKMSNRSRREISRKSERDQGRPSDVNATMGDKGTRTRESLVWLLLSEVEEGTPFIPQFGDEVAYLRQGHAEYLDAYKLDELGPWTMYGEALHHVEFCEVVGLEYAIVSNSGETCCKCTLEFLGNTSGLQGKAFSLTLPELTNFPDFIVEKCRYDASIERQWTTRDRCKVWWKSQHGEGGEWWEGRVVNVKPKSVHFPGSPWERFMVQYKTDPTKKSYCHSPWELFDLSDTRWEHPRIHQDMREHLLFMLESAVNEPEDAFGLRRLKQISGKSDFCNRLPVPLTLEILMQRLQKDYYHSTQAFDFDIQLLLSNAELFCGSQHPVTHGLHAFAREVRTELFCEPSDY